MIDVSEIRDEELNIEDAIAAEIDRSTPIAQSRYNFKVADVVDFEAIATKKGDVVPRATLTLEITNGPRKGKRVFYQRFWANQLVALLMSAGVKELPSGAQKLAKVLVDTAKKGTEFSAIPKWRAFSVDVRDDVLMNATGADSVVEAKRLATTDDYKVANKAATLGANMEDFPLDEDTGERVPFIVCPISGEEKQAQYEVGSFRVAV